MMKLTSLFLSLTLIHTAACVDVPRGGEPPETSAAAASRRTADLRVLSRVQTSTGGIVVDYTIDGRRHRMEIAGAGEHVTQTVRRGTQTLLTMTAGTDGSIEVAGEHGHAFSLAELRDDPSLALLLDQDAAAALDPNVFNVLTGGSPTAVPSNPICLATWLALAGCAVLGIGAYVAKCVDWEYKDGEWTVTGSC